MAATTAFVESSGIIVSIGAGMFSSLLALSARFSKEERRFFFVACATLMGSAFFGATELLGMLFLPAIVVISTVMLLYALKLARRASGSLLRVSVMLAYALLFSVPLISIVMLTMWLVGEATDPSVGRPI